MVERYTHLAYDYLASAAARLDSVVIGYGRLEIKNPLTFWANGFELVPPIGFELMTYRLQGGCSTN